jgi:hypothetical protein
MATWTWTGGGDGTTFADGDNWFNSGTGVPASGDTIYFQSSVSGLINDLTAGTTLNILFANGGYSVDISGNSIGLLGISVHDGYLQLSCDMVIVDNPVYLQYDSGGEIKLIGAISGSGSLEITGAVDYPVSNGVVIATTSNTFSGHITLNGILQLGDRSEWAGSVANASYVDCSQYSQILMWNWGFGTHVFPELRGYIGIEETDYFGNGVGVQFTAFSSVQSFSSVGNVDKTFSFSGSLTANTLTMDSEGPEGYGLVTLRITSGSLTVPDCSGIMAVVNVEDAELYCGSALKPPTTESVSILAARSTLRLNGDNGLYPIIDLNNTLLQIGTTGNDPTTVTLGATDAKAGTLQFDLDASKTPNADSIDCDVSDITLSAGGIYTTLSVSSVLNSTLGESYSILRTSAPGAISGTFYGLADNATFVAGGRTLRVNYTSTEVTLTDVTVESSTKTWSGLGADDNWSTGDNWVGGVAPVAGDDLVFPETPRLTPFNDLAAFTSFASMTFSGTSVISITGASVVITNEIVNDLAGGYVELGIGIRSDSSVSCFGNSSNIIYTAPLSGAGGFIFSGYSHYILASCTFTGSCTILGSSTNLVIGDIDGSYGSLSGSIATASGISIADGCQLSVSNPDNTADNSFPAISGPVGGNVYIYTLELTKFLGQNTMSGTFSLQGGSVQFGDSTHNTGFGAYCTVELNTPAINVDFYTYGTLTMPNITGSLDEGYYITLNGSGNYIFPAASPGYGYYYVSASFNFNNSGFVRMNGAIETGPGAIYTTTVTVNCPLEGDGRISKDAIQINSTLAPGVAGGVEIAQMDLGGSLDLKNGTYSVRINGSTTPKADRVDAGGDITLSDGSQYANLTVESVANSTGGQVYTILHNYASVLGTFNGLADGDTFAVSGVTLRINYLANSVTLTDTSPPPPGSTASYLAFPFFESIIGG